MTIFPLSHSPSSDVSRKVSAFTLIELLTVMAIISIMSLILVPSISSLVSSSDLDKATGDIALTLAQARSYAMAHQTYVFVGFQETDSTLAPSPSPTGSVTPGGRVYMSVVATVDGTSGLPAYTVNTPWTYNPNNLVAIQKTEIFNNVHLADNLPNTGNSARPTSTAGDTVQQIADVTSSLTPFNVPLGTSLNSATAFNQVIQINPQGEVTLNGMLSPWIELGLEPTHGKTLPANSPPNYAAIQIEGTTGAVRVYRP